MKEKALRFDHKKLAAKRDELGYTKDKVSSRAYCKTDSYREWEKGLSIPSEWWLERLAKALNCEPADLCSEKEDMC